MQLRKLFEEDGAFAGEIGALVRGPAQEAREAFDLKAWLGNALGGWKRRMADPGAGSAYALISAMTLWPVVQAGLQGNMAPWQAFLTMLSGIGANLVANRIQQWKDASASEADVIREVAALPPDDPLREQMDQVVQKLKALQLARDVLSQKDREWFTRTLHDELSRVGKWEEFRLQIETAIIHAETVIVQPAEGQDAARRMGEARGRYLVQLRKRCEALPLAALGGRERAEQEVTLGDVYIELDTTTEVPLTEKEEKKRRERRELTGREKDTRPLKALEAAIKAHRLALLGDPGAGKSAFVKRLLSQVAAGEPPAGFPGDLLPVLMNLRDLARRLAELNIDSLPDDQAQTTLAEAVRAQVVEGLKAWRVPEFEEGLNAALDSGQCLLALDGLDEVPEAGRERVREAALAVCREYHLARVIVTCRVRSYLGSAELPGFQAFTLAKFDEPKIRDFARTWYAVQSSVLGRMDAETAREQGRDLADAALADELRQLSSNPMLLTVMAIIHQEDTRLPHQRVRLFKRAVEVLLLRWQRAKTGEAGLAPSLKLTAFLLSGTRLQNTIRRLAYEAHCAKGPQDQAADLARGAALDLLDDPPFLGDATLASEFLDYVDQRAGLLVGQGGEHGHPTSYSFPHRQFQEYLAGCHLLMGRDRERAKRIYERAAEGDYWQEAVRLAAEELHYNWDNGEPELLDLIYRLCPADEMSSEQARRAWLWAGEMAALVGAKKIACDTGGPEEGCTCLARLIPRLERLLGSDLTAPERADAGVALARLGDDRDEVVKVDAMRFAFVPEGLFLMGSKKGDPRAFPGELRQHEVALPAFYLGLYPVTQAQYAEFVKDEGYKVDAFWPEARAAGFWSQDGFKGRWDDEPRSGPVRYGEPFDLDNHPVVGVSWYEALAFTHWLTARWRGKMLPEGWEISLPSEAEREKGARGGLEVPQKKIVVWPCELKEARAWERAKNPDVGRAYPWEGEFDSDKTNTIKAGIRATSAVGCFPKGASPYGLLEMSGNVWEWTRSLWGEDFGYPYVPGDGRENLADVGSSRVVRGGAFVDNVRGVRCAVRGWNHPAYRDDVIGFRVVVSPFFTLSSDPSGL